MLGRIEKKLINLLRQQRMNNGSGASGISSLILSFPMLSKVHRVLVCMDRMTSAALGRPCFIRDEEYVFWM